ncbi:hypothetical protein MNBD_ALPHA07-445 [hydrothermal vent metagenome]|uniref:Uncharacterized protein n=1 Tax=hydrothermal vent metagenome TaxID=652676 RepID=A0A3B0SJX9_9ZZZZ
MWRTGGRGGAVERGFAQTGPVDILVTCAAIVTPARILDFDPEDWGRIITLSPVNGQIANIGRGAVYEDTA